MKKEKKKWSIFTSRFSSSFPRRNPTTSYALSGVLGAHRHRSTFIVSSTLQHNPSPYRVNLWNRTFHVTAMALSRQPEVAWRWDASYSLV